MLANDPTCKAAWYSFKKGHPLKVAAVDSLTLLAAKQDPSVINFQRHTTLLERAATLGSATIALWPWQLFGALQNAAAELGSSTLIIAVTPLALKQLHRRRVPKLQPRPEVVEKDELA
jgi:hypothetical protein